MTALPIFLTAFIFFIGYLLVRSGNALKRREQERCRVYVEETVPAFQWPPRPRPAATDFAADHKSRTRVGL